MGACEVSSSESALCVWDGAWGLQLCLLPRAQQVGCGRSGSPCQGHAWHGQWWLGCTSGGCPGVGERHLVNSCGPASTPERRPQGAMIVLDFNNGQTVCPPKASSESDMECVAWHHSVCWKRRCIAPSTSQVSQAHPNFSPNLLAQCHGSEAQECAQTCCTSQRSSGTIGRVGRSATGSPSLCSIWRAITNKGQHDRSGQCGRNIGFSQTM